MASKPRSLKSPGTGDTFALRPSAGSSAEGRFAGRVEAYLETLYATGLDADDRHTRALEELRLEPGEAVVALAKAEARCHRRDYPRRWALVYAASRMDHDAALPYLRELVLTPIPTSEARDAHAFSEAREETILRTTAIEGIGRVARRGNKLALAALLEFLDISSISVRRASIQAILAADPAYRHRIAQRLPPAFHYLLDVRPAKVTEVPQVKDPKKHLKDKKPLKQPVPPKLAYDGSGKPPKQQSPKIARKK